MTDNSAIEAERSKMGYVYREDAAPGLVTEMILHRILECTSSEYQKIDVVDTYFGKVRIRWPTR